MIISLHTYYAIMAMLVLLIAAKPLYARFIKKQGNRYDAMYFLVLLLLPVNWTVPRIITVIDCNQYQYDIALFPTTLKDEPIRYWKKTYIFNESEQDLGFEFIYYGDKQPKENEQNHTIAPGGRVAVPTVVIDYLFEQPGERVRSKSSGAKKTHLNCVQNNNMANKNSDLNHVLWRFNDEKFIDISAFNDAVTAYHLAIKRDPGFWQPDEIVFPLPQVKILYEAWVVGSGNLLSNELIIEEEEPIATGLQGGSHQVEILATLDADNGKGFTVGEFLMKVHNQMANKDLGDHIFFEGTEEVSSPGTEVPVYYIACGS